MSSLPLGSTHGRTTSGVASHHRLWAAHLVKRRRAWHDITALGQHTQSDYVRRGMTSPPLYSTHGRTTSGVACHHRFWAAHTVERRRAWHVLIAFGQHTRSNDVGRGMPSSPLAAHTVERRRAWHVLIAFGQHTRSKDVWRGMPLLPLGNTNGLTTSGVT